MVSIQNQNAGHQWNASCEDVTSLTPLPPVASAAQKVQKASRNKSGTLTTEIQRIVKNRIPKGAIPSSPSKPMTRGGPLTAEPSSALPRISEASVTLASEESAALYDLLQKEVINHQYWVLEGNRGKLDFCAQRQAGDIEFDIEVNWRDNPIQMKWSRSTSRLDPTQRLAVFDATYKRGDQYVKKYWQALRKHLNRDPQVKVTFQFREARNVSDRSATQAMKWVCILHQTPVVA